MLVHDEWLLMPQRVAVHLPTATAVLSDLHLGYNEARRRDGEAVPPADLTLSGAPCGRVTGCSCSASHRDRRRPVRGRPCCGPCRGASGVDD